MCADRELFERFLFSMIEGRHDEAEALLADDVVWNLPPFAEMAPIEGKKAVARFIREAQATYYAPGSLRLEPLLICAEAGRAACLAQLHATTRKGKRYENRYAFFARLRGGLLCEAWELLDTASFQAQLRGS
jgi:ketosteroid isomerase-like protein